MLYGAIRLEKVNNGWYIEIPIPQEGKEHWEFKQDKFIYNNLDEVMFTLKARYGE